VKFYVRVNDSAVAARFARIGPGVRQGLIDALTPQADAIAADVRSIWSARSKYMGVSTKNPDRVTGYVRSDKPGVFFGGRLVPLAQLLEYGANVPAHQILAVLGKALHFTGSAGETFAKSVQSPGATIPAYPAIHPAFDAHRADIRDAIEGVARKAGEL